MTWIVARAVKNTPGKKDATGAFVPESLLVVKALQKAGYAVEMVDLEGRPEPLWVALNHVVGLLDGLVYLGHGLRRALPSAGLWGLPGARRLAASVAAMGGDDVVVVVNGCSAADGPSKGRSLDGPGTDGGFCDEVRDELCRLGHVDCRVWGRTTPGHASKNPYLAVFEGLGSPIGGQGGSAVVRPRGPAWSTWKGLMADPSKKPSLRHRIPTMTPSAVLVEVARAM